MGSKMLIDAAHPEETRVVVVRGKRIEEFDYESAQRKQLKGNIYLAKVTRVEPSLQAAFVDYGGNRHGFLAFNEIHPDYYQIPIADREALLAEEREDARASQEQDDAEAARDAGDNADDGDGENGDDGDNGNGIEAIRETGESANVDTVGDEDALEEVPKPRRQRRRSYKIQEVIKRRQIILVQVVKEERGNKGAALTTYLSLAGRYCVLMPNTARGGGISRKITDAKDRKRLKEVAREVEVPDGMGLIVRTAGAQRTKAEIKRDYDYLLRVWENVRDLTLKSTAPCLVYEEGNLIKRSIRDLYGKEVDEVLVEGEDAHKEAKAFMKMLMPSHARNVKLYNDTKPLFARHQVDQQLDGLFSPVVTLQSGGYLVINQTEALVSIDINSGKATREHNIEDTAVKTNLEAASEIARQLRLRDLAGLIVIDFIDMEEKRNNRSVERRLKESLKNDRARIQVGRISHFGLLEMSRQRLRQGMLEGSTKPCPHCEGTGLIRSIASCALSVLRAIDDQLMSKKPENLSVKCNPDVAFYILNEKRDHILNLENVHGISIYILPDSGLGRSEVTLERGGERVVTRAKETPVSMTSTAAAAEPEDEDAEAEETAEAAETRETRDSGDGDGKRRRRRRGRRGGRRSRERDEARADADQPGARADRTAEDEQPAVEAAQAPAAEAADEDIGEDAPRKRRRRSRRKPEAEAAAAGGAEDAQAAVEQPEEQAEAGPAEEKPAKKPRKSRAKKAKADEPAVAGEAATDAEPAAEQPEAEAGAAEEEPAKKPRARRKAAGTKKAGTKAAAEPATGNGKEAEAQAEPAETAGGRPEAEAEPAAPAWTPPKQTAEAGGPPKSGWWRRR